jgi:hypothetical protein
LVVQNHLRGAARTAFLAKFGTTDRSQWPLRRIFDAIASLIPDHEVLFTRAALGMSFDLSNLVDDIDSFEMYVRYGSIKSDGNHFIFCELQKKILEACPTIFTLASDLHNERFVWTPNKTFRWHVNRAIEIVQTLQANQQLPQKQAKHGTGPSTASAAAVTRDLPPQDRTGKRKGSHVGGGKPSKFAKKDQAAKSAREQQYRQLARTYSR